jgi:hypothetical protein
MDPKKQTKTGCVIGLLVLICSVLVILHIMNSIEGGRLEKIQFYLIAGIILLMFGTFGFLLVQLFRLLNIDTEKVLEKRKHEYPNSPWMWDSAWSSGRIKSEETHGNTVKILILSLWGGGIFIGAVSFIRKNYPHINLEFIAGCVMVIIAVAVYTWIIRAIVRIIKFGKVTFEMSTFPGRIGNTLEGTIIFPYRVAFEHGCTLKFYCCKSFNDPESQRQFGEQFPLAFKKELRVSRGEMSFDGRVMRIPVSFAIPEDSPESNAKLDLRYKAIWVLEAKAKMPGVDFLANFVVPVFKAGETPVQKQAEQEQPQTALDVVDMLNMGCNLAGKLSIMPTSSGGKTFIISPKKTTVISIVNIVIFLFFTALVAGVYFSDASFFPIVVIVIISMVAANVIMSFMFQTIQIWMEKEHMTIMTRSKIPLRNFQVLYKDIENIKIKVESIVQKIEIYELYIARKDDDDIHVKIGQLSEQEALDLERQIKECIPRNKIDYS